MRAPATLAVDSRCTHGEGVLWCDRRQSLLWIDIAERRLWQHTPASGSTRHWVLPDRPGCIGLFDDGTLLVALVSSLHRADLAAATDDALPLQWLADVDPHNAYTRSNDGRADRQGGFWIGTMSKHGDKDPGAGAIYRWYRGELRKLFGGITIPNAICFAPDGRTAYFADTPTQAIQKVALDAAGWPCAAPARHRPRPYRPDVCRSCRRG